MSILDIHGILFGLELFLHGFTLLFLYFKHLGELLSFYSGLYVFALIVVFLHVQNDWGQIAEELGKDLSLLIPFGILVVVLLYLFYIPLQLLLVVDILLALDFYPQLLCMLD